MLVNGRLRRLLARLNRRKVSERGSVWYSGAYAGKDLVKVVSWNVGVVERVQPTRWLGQSCGSPKSLGKPVATADADQAFACVGEFGQLRELGEDRQR